MTTSILKPIIPLSIFLSKALNLVKKLQFTQDGMNFVKIYKNLGFDESKKIELLLPLYSSTVINIDKIFNNQTFLNNWVSVFGKSFPSELSSSLTSVEVKIVNDLARVSESANITNFFSFEYSLFRQLCCIVFSMYSINLPECTCIPSSYSELLLYKAGVGINCYKLECAQAINSNPKLFDGLFCSTNCTQQICAQAILVNVLSGGNSTININAQQECESVINTINNNTINTNNT